MQRTCRCFRVVTHGEPLVEERLPMREPEGDEVLLRVRAAGVCHSDVFLHEGFIDTGAGRKIDMARGVAAPRVLGHEIAGTVEATGSTSTGAAIGDVVVVYPWIGCGECAFCASGRENLCSAPRNLGVHADGGFAEYVMVPHARYLVPIGDLAPEQAATYACSGLTAYAALGKVPRPGANEKVLVIGAGGVGLSGVRFARRLLGTAPIVAEIDRAKWPLAKEAGASDTIDPSAGDALRTLLKSTGGGVIAAVDFVGTGESFAFGLGALRKGGTLISVGMIGGSTALTPALLPLKVATVIGSYVGTCDELRELIALAREGAVPPLPVTTMPLESVNDALERLSAGRMPGRAVLLP
ncbi:MAG: alcohol dehydrogenase [Burkholderiaceae bacterium]|nr:alcohol dehydrogenase [Burkholderiaceae bacterium]